MKLEHVQQLTVFYEPEQDRRRKVGRLALKDRQILFEYDPAFLGSKLELSPFRLRLTPDVVVGQPGVLDGLMGGRASTCSPTTATITAATSRS